MSLGVNREYKTRNRSVEANLSVHRERIVELMDQLGVDRQQASAMAYEEIMTGTLNKRIGARIQEIKDRQNRKHKKVK
jgi:hypothetical protein